MYKTTNGKTLALRKCDSSKCDNFTKFKIQYDCGEGKTEWLNLCEKHYSNPNFQRFVIEIKEINQ